MVKKYVQSYNNKIDAWVKMEKSAKGTEIVNVKQSNPSVKFKGIRVLK